MPAASRIAPIPFREQSAFEQRITLLCEAYGLRPSALGTKAGFSAELVPKWIGQTRAGVALPGTHATRVQLCEHYRIPLDWFQGRERLPEGSSAPIQKGAKGATVWANDTLSMADAACDMLTRLDGITPAKAWSLMRGVKLEAPSVVGFYEAARRKLSEKG